MDGASLYTAMLELGAKHLDENSASPGELWETESTRKSSKQSPELPTTVKR